MQQKPGDAFDEGVDAARKRLPAEANPYEPHDPSRAARWREGFDSVATAREASESEG